MKITFIIQDLFQQGAQYVTALIIRGFIAKGYDVDLIVSKVHQDLLDKGDIAPFEVPAQTNIIVLHDRKASKNIREIRRYLKHTDSKAVISMSSNYTHALALASIGLRKRPKLAYVEHSSLTGIDRNSGKELNAPPIFSRNYIFSRVITSQYDTIMAVSKGTAKGVERMNRLKPETAKVVYNPVIDNIFGEKILSTPKHEWLINKTIPTIVAAAAHSEFKNHFILFKAVELANKKTPVRLILFGKGELTESYKEWIGTHNLSDKILLAGHSANLPSEIKASDAFIISSNQESFSIVLVEALAAGTPVISTNCPYGPPELLKMGKYGTLVPVNDSQALAEAIVAQIQHPKPPAPKEAWEPYTLEKVVEAYEKALGII